MNNVEKFFNLYNAQATTDLGDISITNIFGNAIVKNMKPGNVISAKTWMDESVVVIQSDVGPIVLTAMDDEVVCSTDERGAKCASWKRAGLSKDCYVDTPEKMDHILAIVESYK